jgi:hypothetical protein
MVALGVGQATLAAATLLGPDSDPLTGWTTAVLVLGSFTLAALVLSGRLPLDVADGQRQLFGVIANASLFGVIANASLVGGIAGTLTGVFLLVAPLVGKVGHDDEQREVRR